MRLKRFKVMKNGTECYFPVLLHYRTIVKVGHSHKNWQRANSEGKRMANEYATHALKSKSNNQFER